MATYKVLGSGEVVDLIRLSDLIIHGNMHRTTNGGD